ncbi:MAG: carbon dioxide concentrating mechanism protein CcmL [Planctomycetaceae bacterium]|nr:carbon dioxide concentrating mechanism protein CcmL [Planctomycetaceae bacterium]|tara:strand:- start:8317 stop:8598 length:282 start_codon:yes stop_codon:yes gene_type:complete
MRFAKVIGTVTLNQCISEFEGSTLKAVVPLSLADLQSQETDSADFLVLWDEMGSRNGDFVALSEGGEAAQPFRPANKPVDAYNAAIIDEINLS